MPRTIPDNVKLLFGPYHPPALRRGDRATCLVRDYDVVVTSWTDSRISWPRCRPLHHPRVSQNYIKMLAIVDWSFSEKRLAAWPATNSENGSLSIPFSAN